MDRLTNFWGNLKKCVECKENSNCYSVHSCDHIAESIAKLRDYEELEEEGKLPKLLCAVGDVVYYRHGGIKVEPMRVDQIIIAKYGINLLLEYCGNDEKLKHWRIDIESTAFDCKIIFLTHEAAESALKEMSE